MQLLTHVCISLHYTFVRRHVQRFIVLFFFLESMKEMPFFVLVSAHSNIKRYETLNFMEDRLTIDSNPTLNTATHRY